MAPLPACTNSMKVTVAAICSPAIPGVEYVQEVNVFRVWTGRMTYCFIACSDFYISVSQDKLLLIAQICYLLVYLNISQLK